MFIYYFEEKNRVEPAKHAIGLYAKPWLFCINYSRWMQEISPDFSLRMWEPDPSRLRGIWRQPQGIYVIKSLRLQRQSKSRLMENFPTVHPKRVKTQNTGVDNKQAQLIAAQKSRTLTENSLSIGR